MNVLIAEEEVVVSLDLKLFLKRNNFRISSIVSSGEDLISDYKMKRPDLMIIDFDLMQQQFHLEVQILLY